jgi:mono/diheme cytochrome c family protein
MRSLGKPLTVVASCATCVAWLSFACAAHAQTRASASDIALYEADCAACHGSDGRGHTRTEVGFDTPLPDFTDCDFASRETVADWTAIVHEGGPVRGFNHMMPAFGGALGDEEIAAALRRIQSFCTDPAWPRGELNVPRALFTEKAFPEDEAVITTSVVTEGNDSMTNEFTWEQRFGTSNQMEISVPYTRADFGDPIGWAGGTGNLAVAVKHMLAHNSARGTILSVAGEVALPTGDESKGLSNGSSVFETYIAFDKLLPGNSFLQLQGIAEIPADSTLENEIQLRGALGKTFRSGGPYGRAWTPIIELLAARETTSGADTEWDAVPQFQVTLSRRQHVRASAGFRVPLNERDARSTEFVFYLLWDWFDGGVLEGW